MSTSNLYSALADVVLVIHFGIVAFVVLGLPAVWIGFLVRWSWVRNLYFRITHLGVMAIVATQAVLGVPCPLTSGERDLRILAGEGERYEGSLVHYWLHQILFFNFEASTFTIAYCIFFAALVLSFVVVKPRWPRKKP